MKKNEAEFTKVLAYIAAAIGKGPTAEQVEVYLDALGHIPIDKLQIAAKVVVLQHKWSTFPTVAEIHEAAVNVMRGEVVELGTAEMWQMAWDAVKRIDPEIEGSVERGTKDLPPIVVQAMETFGIHALCYGREPITVVRSQFMAVAEQLRAKERRLAMLPDKLKASILGIGQMPQEPRQVEEKVDVVRKKLASKFGSETAGSKP